MGIFDAIRGEFIEVIEYDERVEGVLVYKYPITTKQQIKNNAQLIVGPSQVAIFVYEGQVADIYHSGRYSLTTETMPVLTSLKNFKYAFDSPFKTDVYFVSTAQFLNQKWGTSKPITMRDNDFGIVRLRSFGNYSFKIKEHDKFLVSVIGSGDTITIDSISEHLKTSIISTLSDVIASSGIAAIDLPIMFEELGTQSKGSLTDKFSSLALELLSFNIESVSLPEEVEKAIDKRSSMGAIGDLNKYTQYQMADSIKDAAKNEGGMAGVGATMAMGVQMGNMMSQGLNNGANASNNQMQQNTVQQTQTIPCPKCNAMVQQGSKFCSSCGQSMINTCVSCNQEIPPNSKFCSHCGANQSNEKTCSCGATLDANAKFCTNCGQKFE
ncbi:MAG: SPFH domain-containing protein [Lachnospirales bacterium]